MSQAAASAHRDEPSIHVVGFDVVGIVYVSPAVRLSAAGEHGLDSRGDIRIRTPCALDVIELENLPIVARYPDTVERIQLPSEQRVNDLLGYPTAIGGRPSGTAV